ncbi:MAG: hypothetical protein R3211_10250 [Balneolaceae bacterium]|nr:hypothetical protein [Balneolaceae bacterium]
MSTFRILFLVLLTAIISVPALGQNQQEEMEDPFKNDPFFSKPLSEIFKKSDKDSSDIGSEDVQYHVGRLNANGIDYDSGLGAGPYNSNPIYGIYPLMPMIHYNRVNGLFLGLRKERMQWYNRDWFLGIEGIQPHYLVGYSFGQKEFQYTAGLEKFLGRKKHALIGAEYHDATTTDDFWRVGLNETSLTAFIAGYDFLDYYKQTGWGFYFNLRSKRYFEGGISYNDETFRSLEQETDFSIFGSDRNYRVNPPIDIAGGSPVEKADISSINIGASFNPRQLVLSRYFTLSATVLAELADLGDDSDYSYNKYMGEIKFSYNFEEGGVFRYRLRAGGIDGDAPNFELFQLGGIGTIRALPYKSLQGNRMILSNAEVHFGVPARSDSDWIDFDDFYLTIFLDSGWADFDPNRITDGGVFSSFDGFSLNDLKHSAGVGIGSSLIRFELAWDINKGGGAPIFWVRLNPTF